MASFGVPDHEPLPSLHSVSWIFDSSEHCEQTMHHAVFHGGFHHGGGGTHGRVNVYHGGHTTRGAAFVDPQSII